jgi:hypothetical protein
MSFWTSIMTTCNVLGCLRLVTVLYKRDERATWHYRTNKWCSSPFTKCHGTAFGITLIQLWTAWKLSSQGKEYICLTHGTCISGVNI